MRVIATRTDDVWGLVDEAEYIGTDTAKIVFLELGWVKPYDDTGPIPPKGIAEYESGKVYPPNRYIINLGHIYKSNTVTSTSWVLSEWGLKV